MGDKQRDDASKAEKRRARLWMAGQIGAALTTGFMRIDPVTGMSGINALKVAGEAQRITDAIIERLEETGEV